MITLALADRQVAIELIAAAVAAGAWRNKACVVLDITMRTLQRWESALQAGFLNDQRKSAGACRTPGNQLSDSVCWRSATNRYTPVCQAITWCLNRPSTGIVSGKSAASARQGKAAVPRGVVRPRSYLAEGPNQVWNWDVTFLESNIKGMSYPWHLVMDVFSRKIVGWEVHADETAAQAATVIRKACLAESVHERGLVLY